MIRTEFERVYKRRVRGFIQRLAVENILGERAPLDAVITVSPSPIPYDERLRDDHVYRPIAPGQDWGSAWNSAWLRVTGRVPGAWCGKDTALHLNLSSEACVFGSDGCPMYGLTDRSVFDDHYGKSVYRMLEPSRGGETIDLWIEAAANGLFGITRRPAAQRFAPDRHGSHQASVRALELCIFETPVWHLWLDMDVLNNLHDALPPGSPRARRILRALNEAIDAFADDPAHAGAARAALRPVFDVPPNPGDLSFVAVGHAHIDTGWLWPVRETVRKCARTFSSQVALLERYPDYVFGASQPQHYAFVKQHYPVLYEKIRAFVRAGRWECQGAMWVEADCNLTGGESLVRQLVHGKNFFRDEFGIDVRNLWIPDVFGYSAALPQILRRAGVDFFVTQKMSWSLQNEFPFNTFMWRGIDGSEVLTHFPPENNYNSCLYPKALIEAQARLKENDRLDTCLSLFGIGNGGGGPAEEFVERGLRARALNGSPTVRFGSSETVAETMRAHAGDLETWCGELYLEAHRGTLTTQAAVKKGNRECETLLRQTEFLLTCGAPADYPRAELDRLWKLLLINQFHDILPGSSIRAVYEQTLREYDEIRRGSAALRETAASRLLEDDTRALTLFNTLSRPFIAPVRLPSEWAGHAVSDIYGRPIAVQGGAANPLATVSIPPMSLLTLMRGPQTPAPAGGRTPELALENRLVRYVFDEAGCLRSVFDKERDREFLPPGARANLLSLYVDRPHQWDAWDIDIYYERECLGHAAPLGLEKIEAGPVRHALRFELGIGASRIVQTVSLTPDRKRLDFETDVDWQEQHKMLRVAFPSNIRCDNAAFDIQYGYLRRPTHRNTAWDSARFEVAAQRYVDLSDPDGGLALLNDGKYGHKVHDGTIDLNLLRSPTDPDPDADYGAHRFTYALLPHTGGFPDPGVIHEAAMLNEPPLCLPGRRAGECRPPCRLDSDSVALTVLKRAEKGDQSVIRLVETLGRRSRARLETGPHIAAIVETDLLEWKDAAPRPCAGFLDVNLDPFEIRTFKLLLSSQERASQAPEGSHR